MSAPIDITPSLAISAASAIVPTITAFGVLFYRVRQLENKIETLSETLSRVHDWVMKSDGKNEALERIAAALVAREAKTPRSSK